MKTVYEVIPISDIYTSIGLRLYVTKQEIAGNTGDDVFVLGKRRCISTAVWGPVFLITQYTMRREILSLGVNFDG